jgi:hypothetical protein
MHIFVSLSFLPIFISNLSTAHWQCSFHAHVVIFRIIFVFPIPNSISLSFSILLHIIYLNPLHPLTIFYLPIPCLLPFSIISQSCPFCPAICYRVLSAPSPYSTPRPPPPRQWKFLRMTETPSCSLEFTHGSGATRRRWGGSRGFSVN